MVTACDHFIHQWLTDRQTTAVQNSKQLEQSGFFCVVENPIKKFISMEFLYYITTHLHLKIRYN